MSATFAQQKPQWMPGQMGLNSGVMAAPGFTYANMTINYDASAFTGPAGNPAPSVGTYNGVIGYDQFRLTNDSGTFGVGPAVLPANIIPGYAVHAVGGQLTYISMLHNFTMFFKYEHEYKSTSHTLGNTIVFGGTWTIPLPKPAPKK